MENKEFEALKCVDELEKLIEEITIGNANLRTTLKTSVLVATIKQALTELKQIKEANPSEALKEFEEFKNILLENVVILDTDLQRFNIIKQALIKANRIIKQEDEIKQALIKAQEQEKEKENIDYGSARERWKIICQMIKRMFEFDIEEKWSADDKVITQALIKAQENKKVLEIIKEKDVDLRDLKAYFKLERGLQEYNKHQYKENELTQEEFDLLKRWQNA